MGEKKLCLIYAAVARDGLILAEHTDFSGDFVTVAYRCLQSLPSKDRTSNKFIYAFDNYTFNYLAHDGFVFCVVADISVGREVPMAFLDRIKDDFMLRYGGGKGAVASANSLNKEFRPKLKEQMQYCVDHPEEITKLAKVKAQVLEVQGVMKDNIVKALDRGGQISVLAVKTEDLRDAADEYRERSSNLRRKMWLKNMKIKLIILGILIALILLIVLSVCRGFNCLK